MRRRPIAVEICAVIAFKLVGLAILYVAFFGPAHRAPVTDVRAAQAILGATQSGGTP